MASAGSIFVDLLLKDQNYVQGLNRARQNTRGFSGQVQGDLNKTRNAFAGVLSPVNNVSTAIGQLAGITASALSVQQIIRYSDTWKQLEGRLGLVVGEMQSITAVQSELSAIAERTRQPLEGVYNLYTRIAQAIPEAQRGQYDLLGVTESINAALAVTGEGSAQAASAILQFTQALQSDFKASGQEINALLDSAPRLAQAIQRSFGDGSKSLKQLAADSELSRDVILRALSGVGEEGIKLREELAKLPPTVGQAFTQLDNAFLQFIGNSEAVGAGTSSLVIVIRSLADNLDNLANVAVAAGAIFAARLVPSVGKSVATFVSAQASAVSYAASLNATTAALGANSIASQRWAAAIASQQAAAAGSISNTVIAVNRVGQSAVLSASALSTLSVAARTAGASMLAVFGGPIGASVLALGGIFYYLYQQIDQVSKVNSEYAKKSSRFIEIQNELTTASSKRTVQLKKEEDQILATALADIKRSEASLAALQNTPNLSPLALFGIDPAQTRIKQLQDSIRAQYDALDQLNTDANRILNNRNKPAQGTPENPAYNPGKPDAAAAKAAKELGTLYEQNRKYILGLNQETLKYNDTIAELDLLLGAGKITQDQYSDALVRVQEEYDKSQEKAKVWSFSIEDAAEQASKNIQSTFADFLFDPFEDGLDGMLKGFADTLRRMAAEAAAAQILTSIFGEGGFSFKSAAEVAPEKSIFDGLFDGFFADGGYIQPGHFGIAGEAGAELVYGGMSGATVIPQGGGGVSINIINNNNSSVTQSSQKTANGTDITVMIDAAVAANIGTPGSKTNQALGAFSNRSLVRR